MPNDEFYYNMSFFSLKINDSPIIFFPMCFTEFLKIIQVFSLIGFSLIC